jgi:O-antigen ligase
VTTALLKEEGAIARLLRVLWVVVPIEAAFGVLALAAYGAHLSAFGVQINESGFPMAYGTQWEANIFGSYLLGNFFVLLGDYIRGKRSTLRGAALVVVLLGVGVSLTRTVWLALVLCGILFFLLNLRLRKTSLHLLAIFAAVPAVLLAGLVVGSATPFAGRLMDLVNLQSSSASGRFVWFGAALRDWQAHPILGNGTGSFNFNAVPGQPHPWLPNLFLLTLHDTGIVGLAVLVWLLWRFYRTVLPSIREGNPDAVVAAGGVAGFTGMMLAFQMTTGFWFSYPWIVAAVAMAAANRTNAST